MKTEAETGVMLPQAKKQIQPPGVEEPTLRFQICDLQNHEGTHF